MDGVSAAASIWALVEGTGKVIKYLKSVKTARRDQQDLARELLVLYALLCRLAPLASSQEISKIAPSGTSGIDPATFAEYSDALIRLQAKIGTHTQTARGLIAFPFMKEEIKEMLAKIERLKTAIGLGLDIKLLETWRIGHADATSWQDRLEQRQDQYQVREALQWLSSTEHRARKESLCAASNPSTGSWLMHSPKFQQWHTGPERLLFCPGNPGAGKTVLAARTANFLETHAGTSGDTAHVVCIFNEYKTGRNFDEAKALGSVLRQLMESDHSSYGVLLDLYGDHAERQTYPSALEMLTMIKTALSTLGTVYLLVDALDEITTSSGKRKKFLDSLFRLYSDVKNIRVMVTCRPGPDILQRFNGVPSVQIAAATEDITAYIDGRFEDFKAPLDDGFKVLIKDTVIGAAHGM